MVKLVDEGKLSNKLARQVIEGVLAGEGEPEQVMTDRGLAVVRDDSVIQAAVDEALAANPDVAEKIRGGKVQAAGAIVGAVMKATKGQADAARVRELVLGRLQLDLGWRRAAPVRRPHRRHGELLEPLARIGLGVADRQSAEHLGERQHGVAEQRGIETRPIAGPARCRPSPACSAWAGSPNARVAGRRGIRGERCRAW